MRKASEFAALVVISAVVHVTVRRVFGVASVAGFRAAAGCAGRACCQAWLRVHRAAALLGSTPGTSGEGGFGGCAGWAVANRSLNGTPKSYAFWCPPLRSGAR